MKSRMNRADFHKLAPEVRAHLGPLNQAAIDAAEKASTYEWGFTSDIEQDFAPKGLSEDTVRFISAKKGEPEWLLEFRLKAYQHWLTMTPPQWANVQHPPVDFQSISYYSAPKQKKKLASMDEVDPELLGGATVRAGDLVIDGSLKSRLERLALELTA